jgi:hypothetical protein
MAAMQTTQTRWFCAACRRQWVDPPKTAIGVAFDGVACPACASTRITLHRFSGEFPGADLDFGVTPAIPDAPASVEQLNLTILLPGLVGQ